MSVELLDPNLAYDARVRYAESCPRCADAGERGLEPSGPPAGSCSRLGWQANLPLPPPVVHLRISPGVSVNQACERGSSLRGRRPTSFTISAASASYRPATRSPTGSGLAFTRRAKGNVATARNASRAIVSSRRSG